MYTRLLTRLLAIFSVVCLFQAAPGSSVMAAGEAQPGTSYLVKAIKTEVLPDVLTMTVFGSSSPAYTVSERFDPYRLIVDIADTDFDSSIDLEKILPENPFAKLHVWVLKDQQPALARFEFTLNDNVSYEVIRLENDLKIQLLSQAETVVEGTKPPVGPAAAAPAATSLQDEKVAESIFAAPQQSITLTEPEKSVDSEVESLRDSFSFSGYTNKRISVDFFKIDLHNVFRLFRQISDLNIIVDEAVNGSITLALTDVPWDFALDIILNLADLRKEERYNTIVIYPKNKEFAWPERAMDNLSFEADIEVVQEEALIIEQSASQPVEIMQAKELLVKARALEKKDDFEDAAALYEKAFQLWPDNTKISNKLANLYLGRLQMNAKADYYCQKTLEKEPSDTSAALYCAISSANMERIPEAMEFFAQSISETPPMKEALISYAAFSESNGQPEAALKLLETYSTYYGETVQTMVSKARILDKMGKRDLATAQYRALLASGFQLRPDLKQYVEGRISAGSF